MRTERGNVAVLVAGALVAVVGMAALAVDLGYVRVVKAELQNAADAAAHAGTAQLDGTSQGMSDAMATAVAVGRANRAGGGSVHVDHGDVHLGVWDGETFTEGGSAAEVNAVRVDANLPSVALFFAPAAVGRSSMPLAASSTMSTVHSGASAVDCYLPIAMPDCVVEDMTRSGINEIELTFNPAPGDNVGYGRANGSVNAAFTRNQLTDCTTGGEVHVGDPLSLQNGEVQSALSTIVDAIAGSETEWTSTRWGELPAPMERSAIPTDRFGHTLEGVVLVFDAPDEYCTGGGAWNGDNPVVGFVWGAVYDARNTGAAADRTLKMRLDALEDHDVGTDGGGADWGVMDWSPPRMVR